jgi:WXG100 family type VII secretion target
MAGFETGSAELMQAAGEMENANQDLQSQLSQLATAVDAVEGAWKGMAATAFQQLMMKFGQDAKSLNEALLAISEQVTGSAQAYQAQEEAANQSVSQIMSTLEG